MDLHNRGPVEPLIGQQPLSYWITRVQRILGVFRRMRDEARSASVEAVVDGEVDLNVVNLHYCTLRLGWITARAEVQQLRLDLSDAVVPATGSNRGLICDLVKRLWEVVEDIEEMLANSDYRQVEK